MGDLTRLRVATIKCHRTLMFMEEYGTNYGKLKSLHVSVFFLWKVAHNILPSKSFLNSRFRIGNLVCSWCNQELEDQNHILWYCQGAKEVWENISAWWEVNLVSISLQGNLEAMLGLVTESMCSQAWEISIAAVLWSLWLARNDRLFNDAVHKTSDIVFLVKKRSFEWCNLAKILPTHYANIWACYPKSVSIFVQQQRRENFLDLLFHKYDFIAFTDGACNRDIVQRYDGGMGGLVYNKNREIVFIFYGPSDRFSIEDIELEAMCFVSRKISYKWPSQNVVICSDSAVAVKKFHELKFGRIGSELGVYQELALDFFWACKISKSWNNMADVLAKRGLQKLNIIEGFF